MSVLDKMQTIYQATCLECMQNFNDDDCNECPKAMKAALECLADNVTDGMVEAFLRYDAENEDADGDGPPARDCIAAAIRVAGEEV